MAQSRRSGYLLGLTLFYGSLAHGQILPDNDLYLMDCFECESGIGKDEFERVIDQAAQAFTPIVGELGGTLNIVNKWSDSTVNASATQSFGTWTVNMYGGLARRPEITADGFALVLCHELGHHLAGFPFVSRWGANEGQSDYFATNHCAPFLWSKEVTTNASFRELIAERPKRLCDSTYQDEKSQDICYRTMVASKSISDLLGSLTGRTVSFDSPSPKVVSKTFNAHPEAQCRLDTYMAGAICKLEYDTSTIPGKTGSGSANNLEAEKESSETNCALSDEYDPEVLRPRCWFKPNL